MSRLLERLRATTLPTRLSAALVVLYLAALLVGIRGVGVTWDEQDHRDYGLQIVSWYHTHDPDSPVMDVTKGALPYYGGLFDVLGAGLEALFPHADHTTLRHALTAIFSAVGLAFTILLGRALSEGLRRDEDTDDTRVAWAGLIAGATLAFYPRWTGDSLFNPVDVPFAAMYVAAIYFLLRIVDRLPDRVRPRDWIAFGIADGLALGIRIGGLLPIAFLAAMLVLSAATTWRDAGKPKPVFDAAPRVAAGAAGSVFLAWLVAGLFWPRLLLHPISHTLDSLGAASKFPWTGFFLFGGELITGTQVPKSYLPTWFFITAPLHLLGGLAIAFFLGPRTRDAVARDRRLALLALAILFPPFYAVYEHATLYDGLRHFLFTIPPLCALAAIGWWVLIEDQRKRGGRILAAGAFAVLLLEPAWWFVRSHPFEYTYFSPLAGGMVEESHLYETDYWGLSYAYAARFLERNRDLFGDIEGRIYVQAVGCHVLKQDFERLGDDVADCGSKPARAPTAYLEFYRWHPVGWELHDPAQPAYVLAPIPGQVPFLKIFLGPGAKSQVGPVPGG